MTFVHMQILYLTEKQKERGKNNNLISSSPTQSFPAPGSPRDLSQLSVSTSHPRARTVAQSHCRVQLQAACLSSVPPRRSARPPPPAVASRPPPHSWAAAPRCTWRSRAGPASRPARSGASRSAVARSAAAASRPPTRTRTPARRGRAWSGRGSRWGSRCRRSPCRTCRTRRSPTSGRGPTWRSSASSCSTCGPSASSSLWLLVALPWLRITMGHQTSETLLLSRNQPRPRSSLKSLNHLAPMCLKVIQLR